MLNDRFLKESLGLAVIYWVFSLFIALALVVSGAGGAGRESAPGTVKTAPLSTTFPMTVTDDLGRTVTISRVPQRIVSLAPSNTEIVFALGLGDKLVGDTTFCNYPPEAQTKEKIGGYSDTNIEKVVSLEPDLVLAEDIHKQQVIPALERLGITCYALVPHNLDEIMASIQTVGRLTGTSKAAQSIVSDMQKRIKAVSDKTAKLAGSQKPRVLYVIWGDPLMSVGVDTPINEMINLAGGVSIVKAGITGFPTLSLEEVIAANPQVIVCNVDPYPAGDDVVKSIQQESRLGVTDAVAKGQVYGINASLTNQPVPRIIQGLEWLAAIIHPELFPKFVTEYMGTSS